MLLNVFTDLCTATTCELDRFIWLFNRDLTTPRAFKWDTKEGYPILVTGVIVKSVEP